MHAPRIFLYACLAFLGGVALNSFIAVPVVFLAGISILGLMLAALLWRKDKKIVVIGLCLFVFALGIYRSQMMERPTDTLDYYTSYNQKAAEGANSKDFITQSITGAISGFKGKLRESLDSSLSPPQSAILGAMMLGERERISYDLKQKLNRSGTRHITAISGMHVMILANMLIGLGLILGMWRGQAFYFALAAIILFIIMVGAPPSAIRAGIMGGVVLLAEKVGRLSQAQRLLVIAATLMLVANPLLLRFDVGFQLSFFATLGISKVSPWFREKLSFVPSWLGARSTMAMTFPAILFTAPILASNFGQLSLVSVFTNILIVPVLALVLGLGFFAGILGMITEPLGQIAFWPVWLLLTYVYTVIDWAARFPYAAVQIEVFPWYLVILYFALLWWGIKYFKLES